MNLGYVSFSLQFSLESIDLLTMIDCRTKRSMELASDKSVIRKKTSIESRSSASHHGFQTLVIFIVCNCHLLSVISITMFAS